MNIVLADVWDLSKAKEYKYPKNYKIIWNPREILILLWQGKVQKLLIPQEGTPGYDFTEFTLKLYNNKGLNKLPSIAYY